MKRIQNLIQHIFPLLLGMMIAVTTSAARVGDPEVFLKGLHEVVAPVIAKKANETEPWGKFESHWSSGAFSDWEREQFINLYEYMQSQGYDRSPESYLELAKCLDAVKQTETTVGFPMKDFFLTTRLMVEERDAATVQKYLKELRELVASGKVNGFGYTNPVEWRLLHRVNAHLEYVNGSPRATFSDVAWEASAGRDARLLITRTSGSLELLTKQWYGTGGSFGWPNSPSTTCSLGRYGFDMKASSFALDSVSYLETGLPFGKVLGAVRVDVGSALIDDKPKDMSFLSYRGDLHAEVQSGLVAVDGGFARIGLDHFMVSVAGAYKVDDVRASLRGRYPSGGEKAGMMPVVLRFMRDSDPVFEFHGNKVAWDPQSTSVACNDMEMIFIQDIENVSYHPSVSVKYDFGSGALRVTNEKEGIRAHVPFFTPFYKTCVYFDVLKWTQGTDLFEYADEIDQENAEGRVVSESYYVKDEFHRFREGYPFNPVGVIVAAYLKNKKQPQTIAFVCKDMDPKAKGEALAVTAAQLENALPKLVSAGMIDYDGSSGLIRPTGKALYWQGLASGTKKSVWDSLAISTNGKTGKYVTGRLGANSLEVAGITSIALSHDVEVYPLNGQLTLGQNRMMDLLGEVVTGEMRVQTTNIPLHYDYGSNQISFANAIAGFNLTVGKDGATERQKALNRLKLEGCAGYLEIDDPNNKGGQVYNPEFPRIKTTAPSNLFFEHVQGGKYKREDFYFRMNEFDLDSLGNLNEDLLKLDGIFHPGRVVEAFSAQLTLVAEGSTTFGVVNDFLEPVKLYGMQANRYAGRMVMDEAGLHGKGKVWLDQTAIESDHVNFSQDSLTASDASFRFGEEAVATLPLLSALHTHIHYDVANDDIRIQTADQHPMVLFADDPNRAFDGEIRIQTDLVTGRGRLRLGDVQVSSHEVQFAVAGAKATNCRVAIALGLASTDTVLTVDRSTVAYEFNSGKMNVTSLNASPMSLPFHGCETTMRTAVHDAQAGTITLGADEMGGLSHRVSLVNGNCRGLGFDAVQLIVDQRTGTLRADSVKVLKVADALVTPQSGQIVVLKGGVLAPLGASLLEIGASPHMVAASEVSVIGHNAYTASGTYAYVPFPGKKETIELAEIETQNGVTVAIGRVGGAAPFLLGKRIQFEGKVLVQGDHALPHFSGTVSVETTNAQLKGKQIAFDSDVENGVFQVPIPSDRGIRNGILVSAERRSFYPSFLGATQSPKDGIMIATGGYLAIDPDNGHILIGSKARLQGLAPWENVLEIDDQNSIYTASGKAYLPVPASSSILQLEAAGKIEQGNEAKLFGSDLEIGLDLPEVPRAAWESIVSKLQASGAKDETGGNLVANLGPLSALMAENEADKLYPKLQEGITKGKVPSALLRANHFPLLLSGVRMQYDPSRRQYVHDGTVTLVASAGKELSVQVHLRMAYVPDLGGKDGNGRFALDLSAGDGVDEAWLYVACTKGAVQVASSDFDGFNPQVAGAISAGKEKLKLELLEGGAVHDSLATELAK